MNLSTNHVFVAFIIGLVIGAGVLYAFDQNQINLLNTQILGLQQQTTQLEDEYTVLQNQFDNVSLTLSAIESTVTVLQVDLTETQTNYTALQISYSQLSREYTDLQNYYSGIEANYQILNQKYTDLLDLHNITEVKGYTQTINYTIYSGDEMTWTFYLPHGILWEAMIRLTYDYCSMSHSWRQGDVRTFAGSSGRALNQYNLTGIPLLTGTITCDYYDAGGSTIYVTCSILTQYTELSRDAGDYISQ